MAKHTLGDVAAYPIASARGPSPTTLPSASKSVGGQRHMSNCCIIVKLGFQIYNEEDSKGETFCWRIEGGMS
jgi:hypothetical protein